MSAGKLQGKGLLTPLQRRFLLLFARLPDQDRFYLTGGTALAEFYLGHRLSFDLDLFTHEESLIVPTSYLIEKNATESQIDITVARRFASFVELLIREGDDSIKVELALDSPFRFAPPAPSEDGFLVNDYQDLLVDKLLAYYGRAEPRDAIDLYFILQKEPLVTLLDKAKQKDPGFDLYWFAVALERCLTFPDDGNRWPVSMLVPFDAVEIKRQFKELAIEIMDQAVGKKNNRPGLPSH